MLTKEELPQLVLTKEELPELHRSFS